MNPADRARRARYITAMAMITADDHHLDMLGHADRGEDRVDREHHVDHRDLG